MLTNLVTYDTIGIVKGSIDMTLMCKTMLPLGIAFLRDWTVFSSLTHPNLVHTILPLASFWGFAFRIMPLSSLLSRLLAPSYVPCCIK